MKATVKNTLILANDKGIGFSVSRLGKKYGFEYWTTKSIKAGEEPTQFKGKLKDFYSFLLTK